MESEWFTAKQLTEIAPLPTTSQGLHSHARKSAWIRRKRDGKTIEYHIDSLPEEVKEVLHLHQVNETRAFYRLKSNDESIGAQLWDDVCEKIPLLQREKLVELALLEGVNALFFRLASSLALR
ncbi:MAG: DNA-binding protein [Hafnia alvei]|nr:DNA-binding protein [Hafnia alvei]